MFTDSDCSRSRSQNLTKIGAGAEKNSFGSATLAKMAEMIFLAFSCDGRQKITCEIMCVFGPPSTVQKHTRDLFNFNLTLSM